MVGFDNEINIKNLEELLFYIKFVNVPEKDKKKIKKHKKKLKEMIKFLKEGNHKEVYDEDYDYDE